MKRFGVGHATCQQPQGEINEGKNETLPAAGVRCVSGVRVHRHRVHGDVRNKQGLPVFEATAAPDLL